MGPIRNKQGELKFMTLGSMKKVVRRSWDSIQMPDTVIARVNTLGQGQPNYLDFLGCKKRTIEDINVTRLDAG